MKYRIATYFANPVSLVGAIMAAVGFGSSTVLLVLDLLAPSGSENPYRGILTYLVFPSVIFLGFAVAITGAILYRRRVGAAFPRLDLNDPRQRRAFFAIVTFTLLFLLLSALGGYKAFEFTEEVAFCGRLCHEVMDPEYTAYLNSPHARVKCVECHVGAGAEWYVKAKLSGLYQVYATLMNVFPRPIPTPIENLRPAQDTCAQCHWPAKFYGAQLVTKVQHSFDVTNTRREIMMLVKTGGGGSAHGPSEGIHWHMNIRNKIEYVPRDPKRLDIPWFRVTYPDGSAKVYTDTADPPKPDELATLPRRRLDCMDCHNRPSHTYLSPSAAVDQLLSSGKIDAKVPYLKEEATRVLAAEYATADEAARGIAASLVDAYTTMYPEIARSYRKEILAAVPELQAFYRHDPESNDPDRRTFFPAMKARWSVYPMHLSHKEFPGCFRCHNENHKDEAGKALSSDCSLCHNFVARAEDGKSIVQVPADPTLYHPWGQAQTHRSLSCWNCHGGGSSPYTVCGNCHDIDPKGSMAFACITCHDPPGVESSLAATAPPDAQSRRRLKDCTVCHAVGGSELHLVAGHKACLECHQAHEWKPRDPQDCTRSCHTEFAKTHYPEREACMPCHDFKGVTSGFGSAPVPPSVRPQKVTSAQTQPAEKEAEEKPRAETPEAPVEGKYGKNCVAADCHAKLLERPVVHGPVASRSCERCHRETDSEKHSFEFIADEKELCVNCHVLRHDKSVAHKPFAEKLCIGCHDPHGGADRSLLAAETLSEVCEQCHSKPADKVIHVPVEKGECSKCHAAHQSDQPRLLLAAQRTLCTSCHAGVEQALGSGVIHAPVERGCGDCHRAHASPNPKLLSAFCAPDFYAAFKPEAYELCFSCHAKELFLEPESQLTGFRNGTRNLHHLHVVSMEKGRTCRACHESHGGVNSKLVRASVPFGPGGWSLPIGFRPTATGGSCTSGCHPEAAYEREKAPSQPK